jgi:endonuclease/exonuclease/phosphatase family metal-dependent hydrolase
MNEIPTFLRVMAFNIRYDNPRDGDNAWPHRKDLAASMLRLHRPDVVGMQEALAGQVEDLAARLPDFAWVGVGRDDGATRGEFAAVFYRRARLTPLENGTFWLSETPAIPGSMGWDAHCVRTVTWGRFRDNATGGPFLFLNTHFDHAGKRARRESALMLLDRVHALAGAAPVVVTGDLNCTEASATYRLLTQGRSAADFRLHDAKVQAETPHHGPTGTFHAFTGVLRARIDYIFVSKNVRVLRHATLADHRDGRYPSDHMPVVADVVMG